MQIWMTLILVVQLLSALVMIGLVLIQHGKGADMGASFGSGASGSLFGASGSANFLSRSTAACASVFFVCTLALAYLGTAPGVRATGSGASVLDRPAGSTIETPAPAGAVPSAVPSATPAAASASALPAASVTSPPTVAAPAAATAPATAPSAPR